MLPMTPATRSEVLVLIPALNEQDTVAAVVNGARTQLDCDVLVINDGSSDRTSELALGAGAMVVEHPFNLGVGAAIRTGLRIAAAHGVPARVIGRVTNADAGARFTISDDTFRAPVAWLAKAFHEAIPQAMDGETPAEHAVSASHAPVAD